MALKILARTLLIGGVGAGIVWGGAVASGKRMDDSGMMLLQPVVILSIASVAASIAIITVAA